MLPALSLKLMTYITKEWILLISIVVSSNCYEITLKPWQCGAIAIAHDQKVKVLARKAEQMHS